MGKILDWQRHIGRRIRLRDLHVFFTVVEWGSMAKAAAHLRVTQPAVSQVVNDLEHELGVKLLERSPQGAQPTIYGRALLKGGVAAFDELKQTIKEIQFLADPTVGEVRVGCPESIATLLLPTIQRLASQHPGVVVHLSNLVVTTFDVPQLRERNLDLAIVRIPGRPLNDSFPDDLSVEILFDDDVFLVAGEKSHWARRRSIDLAELAAEPWTSTASHTFLGRLLGDAFRARGLEAPVINPVTVSLQLRLNLLAEGSHLSLLPRSIVYQHAARWSLKVLPVELPHHTWPIAIATVKNRTMNPVARLFIDHVRDALKLFAAA